MPETVLRDKNAVIGKYAAVDLKKDDYLLPVKLSDKADSANDVFRSLNGAEVAISVAIPNYATGLSGKLQNGDIVSVIVQGEDNTMTIPAELKYIKVITTTTASGYDNDQQTPNSDGTTEQPATVTFLANARQAQLLAGYDKIHIALVFRGDANTAQQFLNKQKEMFK